MWRKRNRESDLDRELRSHLEIEAAELRAKGVTPGDAGPDARRVFGNVERIKEEVRDTWSGNLTQNFLQDVRYGARTLLRTPGFALAAILTLAAGIGGNTAVFSAIHTVLLKPLAYKDPERLVRIWETHPIMPKLQASYPDFEDWRKQAGAFQDMAAYSFEGWKKFNVVTANGPELVLGSLATQNLLPLMGVETVLGRNLTSDEMEAGHDDVALAGYRMWQTSFGGDPGIVGRAIRINGTSTRIVGVLPDRHEFPLNADLVLPMSKLGPFDLTNRKHHQVEVIGRLKPGVPFEQGRVEVDSITRRLQSAFPSTNKTIGSQMTPLTEAVTGDLRKPLLLLMGSVGFVLLIACVNVAHLLLARSAGRQREMAIRVAVGASRVRILTQLLTESMILALSGAMAGLLLAALAIPALRTYAASRVPRMAELAVDPVVLGFTLAVAIVKGILFGIVPALRASRIDQADALRASGTVSSQQRGSTKIRRVLVVAEIALAMVVVTGGGLLARSFIRLLAVDPGFRTDRILTMRVPLQGANYQSYDKVQGFYNRLNTALRSMPGVTDVATIDTLPFRPGLQTRFAIKGDPAPEAGHFPVADARTISPNYSKMMGIRVLDGRAFTDADATITSPTTCLVNAAFVRRYMNNGHAVGRSIILGVMDPKSTAVPILGVIADTRGADLALDAVPTMFLPGFATPASVLIAMSSDAGSLASAARNAVLSIDREQPVAEMQTLQQILDESLARRRFSVALLSGFSLLALLLAAIGLYAVVSYSVTQRTQEFGLRMALGASRPALFRMVVGESIQMNGLGLALGLIGSLFTSRLLESLLFNMSPSDPFTLGFTSVLLFTVGVLGALIPGLRAAAVEPMQAIRHE